MVAFFCPPPFMTAKKASIDMQFRGGLNSQGVVAGGAFTASAVPIGPASADRIVLVFVSATSAFTGPTIGGVAGSLIIQSTATNVISRAFYLSVPSGETVDITVVNGGTQTGFVFGVYTITGSRFSVPAASVAAPITNADAAKSLSITVPAGGVMAANLCRVNGAGATAGTLAPVTRHTQQFSIGSTYWATGASLDAPVVDATTGTVTGNSGRTLVAVAWE